jgi:ATP-dependent helicase/nuclease subunit B
MGTLYTGTIQELEQALVARVRELRRGHVLAPLTVIVGSAPLRTRVGDVLVRELGGIANVAVVTLASFAAQAARRRGDQPAALLASPARERLLRRLLAQAAAREQLRYFGPVSQRPHLARALLDSITDLREALVPPAALAQVLGGGARHADLAALSAAWLSELERLHAADEASLYSAAAAALARRDGPGGGQPRAAVPAAPGREQAQSPSPSARRAQAGSDELRLFTLDGAPCEAEVAPPADAGAGPAVDAGAATAPGPGVMTTLRAQVMLYGFYDLNGAQEQLARVLLQRGADAFVPLPPGAASPAWPMVAAARRAGCEERPGAASAAASDRERVAAITGAADDAPLALSGDGSMAVVSVQDERAEAREAAREVLEALQRGAAAWDCAVVVPAEADKERIAQALRAAGLPVACRLPDHSPQTRTLLRVLDCLAPVAGRPFGRRAVLDLLATAQLSGGAADPRLAALWADEARRAGVVGGIEQWTERLARRRRGLERRAQERAEAAGQLADDTEQRRDLDLQLRAVTALQDAVAKLRRACDALPAVARWSEWAQAYATLAERLLAPTPAAAAADAVQRLQTLDLLDERVDQAEAGAVLREQLAAARTAVGRAGRDGVAVLTPLECRGLRFHTLVFTGLAEGGFPGRGRPDPILGDADRRRLMQAFTARLRLAEGREAEEAALFALACQGADHRLVLLAPRAEAATGRPRLPSRTLLRLARQAAGRPVGLDELLRGDALRPVWRRAGGAPPYGATWVHAGERDVAVLLSLSSSGPLSGAADYLAAALGDAAAAGRRLGQWRSTRSAVPGAWDGLLGAEARAVVAARRPFAAELHPTRLERFITCPFAFLLRDVLGLEAPEEPDDGLEMDPREFGNLAHEILRRTYQAVIEKQLDREGAEAELQHAWEASCAEAERRGVTGAPLAWRARREALRQDLVQALRDDPVFARGAEAPLEVEWSFGQASGRPVTLDLGEGRTVSFAGRIDRIDATPSGRRVIDYKTGGGGTERQHLADEVGVQLPVYQLAVRQAWPQAADVACEYRLVTRRGGFASLPLPRSEDESSARLRQLVGEAARLMEQGLFPRTRRDRCDYCELRYGCGTSGWTRARKRRHELLDAVVALQSKPSPHGADAAVDGEEADDA